MAWINGQADRIIYKQFDDRYIKRFWDTNHNPVSTYTKPDADVEETHWYMACMHPDCFQCATVHNAAFFGTITAARAAKFFAQKGWYEDEETGEMYCQLHTPIQESVNANQ